MKKSRAPTKSAVKKSNLTKKKLKKMRKRLPLLLSVANLLLNFIKWIL